MNKRNSLLFFLLVFSSLNCFSAVFVVTSNADSGAGTLRDALTQAAANGSTTTDYISFNFSDVSAAGRTITLLSQLPAVSSNLIIDGTTQGGARFGVSNARVALFYNTPVEQTLSGLSIINQSNVSIFGLYIKNITDVTKASMLYYWKGIDIQGGSNITIGQTGKGNVITGFYFPLTTNWQIYNNNTSNVTLQNNIFAIDADGETLSVNTCTNVVLQNINGQINIGGTIAEGNLFAGGLNTGKNNVFFGAGTANIVISNNNIGVDYAVKTSLAESYGLSMTNSNKGDVITIEDNVVDNQLGKSAIYLDFIDKLTTVLRNYIGTDKTSQVTLNTSPIGIFAHYSTQVQIGSDNSLDANFITGCKPVEIDQTQVSVNKNSFFCTINEYPMYDTPDPNVPVVAITNITNSTVSGTATPNSIVELFYSDKCNTCSPQTFFAEATSIGTWTHSGIISGNVIIASTTLNGYTSEFTETAIDSSKVKVTNACNGGLGSITGMVPYSAINVKWVDKNGNLAGTTSDLTAKPGIYKLEIGNGSCEASSAYYQIKNTFDIDISQAVSSNTTCGNNTGAITGITVKNNTGAQTNYIWKDVAGTQWGTALQLQNVPAGSYSLSVSTSDNSCTQVLGPFQVKNTDAPTIVETTEQVRSTSCGKSSGSITNIQVTGGTGNYKYIWWNGQQQRVGTDADLTGQPAGTYQLEVTDGSKCGISYSTYIQIPETNGITLDESKVLSSPASCELSNGSIAGIQASGATSYQWVDGSGKIYITTTPDLTKAPAGTYTLTASNTSGCSKTSQAYTIISSTPTQYPAYVLTLVQPCAGQSNGSLTITPDALVRSERWVNIATQNVLYGASITNLSPGTYQLYLTDNNGCESLYNTYTLTTIPALAIETPGVATASTCGLNSGRISGLVITGGIPPYTYNWTDINDNAAGTNSNDISNLLSGTYNLIVTDTHCGQVTASFTVPDNTIDIPMPSVSNIQLCSSGGAMLKVNDPVPAAVYNLYDSPTSSQPIASQTGGQFKITVNSNTSFYISQVNGTCESSRAKVDVIVGLSALSIANTFTPNGDGINDFWQISNIENYPAALVQVFNRYGQKVYESRGYSKPFDGTYNGQKLPSGVYYYIINLSSNCNLLSGSLTVLR